MAAWLKTAMTALAAGPMPSGSARKHRNLPMPALSRSHIRFLHMLKAIYEAGEISRTDLVERTGYSAFLVSKMCDELLESDLIEETGPGNSTGGRPPTLLSINPHSGRVVGLHIGALNARIAVTNLRGALLAFRKSPSYA